MIMVFSNDNRTFANDNERVAHLFNLYAEAVKRR